MNVVLPAPFGPISACRAPCSSRNDDVVGGGEAAEALRQGRWFRERRAMSRSPVQRSRASTGAAAERPRSAAAVMPLAAREDEHDEDQADPELPVLRRQAGEQVLQDLEHDRADEPAVEIADAADTSTSSTSAERWKASTSSETNCVVCASSAPAMPA